MMHRKNLACGLVVWLCATTLLAQTVVVRGRVEVVSNEINAEKKDAATAGTKGDAKKIRTKAPRGPIPATVVWLTAAPGSGVELSPPTPDTGTRPRLVQRHKSFEPHLLVVPAGSTVEFPNRDPFFHNVFSLFEGKKFDLGLYEAGTSRTVRFDRPGISYIFCNIHPQMSAVVITMGTPLYSIATRDGQLSIADVPYGRYIVHVWSEGIGPENEALETREITIGENATSLGSIRVPLADGQHVAHKNKYGREYEEPTPDSSIYEQQR